MKRRSYQVSVMENPSTAVLHGQQAATASAVALANTQLIAVTVKADPTNAIPVYIGSSIVTTSNGFRLDPGDTHTVEVENANLIYIIAATTGANVSWIGKR